MKTVFSIGWGKRSLAPDYPVPIQGQFHLRVSRGNFSPVLASALLMENGEDLVAFVSCDMVNVPPVLLQKVQDILRREIPGFPVEKLIINATHTHAGPGAKPLGDYPRQDDFVSGEKLEDFLAEAIAGAVKDAWDTRAPGSVAYGYGYATTGHSRRTVYLDDLSLRPNGNEPGGIAVNGHGRMYGSTSDEMFSHYEAGQDSFINLLYTFDAADKVTGAVINVPCPSQTNEQSWILHASFWHNVREKLTAKYGENFGVVGQSAAAGDLSPRQLHYRAAEERRYRLKYAEAWQNAFANPVPGLAASDDDPGRYHHDMMDLMRAEDIANRIVEAFEEVLAWAGKEKLSDPVLRHEIRVVPLARRMFPQEWVELEKKNLAELDKEAFITDGPADQMLRHNSILHSRRTRCSSVVERSLIQEQEPAIPSDIHAVRIGDIAFATNRFELFMDFMHRIQGRSPFMQTFIVQLVTGPNGSGSYLATERGNANKGYSASPYCNLVSPEGGQQLVNETLNILKEMI